MKGNIGPTIKKKSINPLKNFFREPKKFSQQFVDDLDLDNVIAKSDQKQTIANQPDIDI
jgi:hypothetical protein